MRPFHLAFPVVDLTSTERFYVDLLGCTIGRRTDQSLNLNFFGHQIVAHCVDSMPDYTDGGRIDGRQVPPFHFGLVMEWTQWHEFRDHLDSLDVKYRLKPHVRYPGSIGEQATLFIDDPSGNAIELKSFQDDARLFATLLGSEHAAGGGRLSTERSSLKSGWAEHGRPTP